MRSPFFSGFSRSVSHALVPLAACLLGATAGSHLNAGNAPTARIDYAAHYFAPLGGIILHGGWGPSGSWQPLSETWKLDATGWAQLTVENAPALSHHGMTWDEQRQLLVVVGQSNMGPHQIWEFNGTQWSKTAELTGTDFMDAEIAYDANRQRLVVYRASFGGLEETWEYEASAWRKLTYSTKPVACFDGALFKYDATLKKVVLVGNKGFAGATETWLWDGANWSQATGAQPPKAITGGMAFDSARNQMVLLTTEMTTWTFDGAGWTQLNPAHSPIPAKMGFFNLAYDAQRQVCSFFSGEAYGSGGATTYPTATWEWNGTDWQEFTPGTTPPVQVAITIRRLESGQVRVAWPKSASNGILQAKERLDPALEWLATALPVVTEDECSVTFSPAKSSWFSRLQQP